MNATPFPQIFMWLSGQTLNDGEFTGSFRKLLLMLKLNQWLQIEINAEDQESYEIRLEDNLVCLHA